MKLLSVIGGGKVGRTFLRLWTRHGVFQAAAVLDRSPEIAAAAVEFAGAGWAVNTYEELLPADVLMLAVSDEEIEKCCRQLCERSLVRPGMVLFHCSGALESAVLAPAQTLGAAVASLHPVKSFADPLRAAESFAGTHCALEGDEQACRLLSEAVATCGGIPFRLKPAGKTIYHAGTVFACNYVVALLELGLRCLEHAGVAREQGLAILQPLVTETVGNVFALGPARALTGPVARGEAELVSYQAEALARENPRWGLLYAALGEIAAELATAQGSTAPDKLKAVQEALRRFLP